MNNWVPSQDSTEKILKKTNLLIDNFQYYLTIFDKADNENQTFSGPSLYFHFKCIEKSTSQRMDANLNDIRFYEYLYATLASWGMHRMGNSPTKLCDFDVFRAEIYKRRESLFQVEKMKIWELTSADASFVINTLSEVLDEMKVSKADASLVANSKVFHHLLPNLIPPIDRSYTLAFFEINKMLPSQKSASSIFLYLYPAFIKVAKSAFNLIQGKIVTDKQNWYTSFTKIIDNAIIGGMK